MAEETEGESLLDLLTSKEFEEVAVVEQAERQAVLPVIGVLGEVKHDTLVSPEFMSDNTMEENILRLTASQDLQERDVIRLVSSMGVSLDSVESLISKVTTRPRLHLAIMQLCIRCPVFNLFMKGRLPSTPVVQFESILPFLPNLFGNGHFAKSLVAGLNKVRINWFFFVFLVVVSGRYWRTG